MTSPFGMPTFVKVGKKKTPKQLGAPGTVRPPTESGEASLGPDYTVVDDASNITTGYTHAYPSNIAVGDKILLAVYSFYGVSAASGSVTAAGFTVLQDRAASSDRLRLTFFERTADGTEDSNTTITVTGGTPQEAASMMWFVKSGPIDYSVKTLDSAINADKNNHDPPAVTVSHGTANYLVFAVDGWYNAQLDAAPTNYTFIRTDDPPTGKQLNPRISVAYQLISLSTSEDPGAFTVSNTAGQEPYLGTIAVLAESTAPVATGDHTHTTADVTDAATASALGQILVSDGDSWETLTVGANDQVLTADSAQPLGVKWAASAGGSTAVNDLTDVTITSVADNEVLAYDSGTAEWINQTAAEAGLAVTGHTHTEADVTDLDHWTETDHDALDHTGLTGVDGATVLHGATPQSDGSLRFGYGVDASGRPTYTAAGTSDTKAIVVLVDGRAVAREVTI